jgi:hypothetical protein
MAGRGRRGGRGRVGGIERGYAPTSSAPSDTWQEVDDLQTDTPPPVTPFCQQPGPRITLQPTATPLDFFTLFFDDAIKEMLVDGTNSYAADVIAEKERAGLLTPQSRWRSWKPVSVDEMKAVLALIINMGVIHCPEREGYWKTSWESYIPFFHDVLPRNR